MRSAPTRFGEKYLDEITDAGRIALGLHANLVDLRLDDGLTRVEGAVFRGYAADDPGFTVRARSYACAPAASRTRGCCSTSPARSRQGIGNRNGLVGPLLLRSPGHARSAR